MGLEEAFDSAGFYILAGLGVGAEVIGYIIAKKSGLDAFPLWQFGILILATIIAAAFFATRD